MQSIARPYYYDTSTRPNVTFFSKKNSKWGSGVIINVNTAHGSEGLAMRLRSKLSGDLEVSMYFCGSWRFVFKLQSVMLYVYFWSYTKY